MIALKDRGWWARYTLDHREEVSWRELNVTSERVHWDNLVKMYTKVTGKPAVFKRITIDEFYAISDAEKLNAPILRIHIPRSDGCKRLCGKDTTGNQYTTSMASAPTSPPDASTAFACDTHTATTGTPRSSFTASSIGRGTHGQVKEKSVRHRLSRVFSRMSLRCVSFASHFFLFLPTPSPPSRSSMTGFSWGELAGTHTHTETGPIAPA
ncbi:hypothetical protein B0H19DRAFT_1260240 [Mycena capillaripes]|nr:hypothetical protein B0H19DRAFT_1260240 [Mycena capillaripes]